MHKHLPLITFLFLIAGCNSNATNAIPTVDPDALAQVRAEGIVVTFDGEACTASAPRALPAGEYLFTLNDLTGEGYPDLWLGRFTGGNTYQDFLDAQAEPGLYIAKPDYLDQEITKVDVEFDLTTGEKSTTYSLEEGEYAIYIFNVGGAHWNLWICAPLSIVEPSP